MKQKTATEKPVNMQHQIMHTAIFDISDLTF